MGGESRYQIKIPSKQLNNKKFSTNSYSNSTLTSEATPLLVSLVASPLALPRFPFGGSEATTKIVAKQLLRWGGQLLW
jgi:hypothetical protein